MFVLTLLVAGNETTRTLVSNGLHALARHPDQRRRLVDHPALIGFGVEELLRWEAPIMSFCRTATREVELGGKTRPRGPRAPVLPVGQPGRGCLRARPTGWT